jgi:valyl-tRNA synthetase
MRPDVPEKPTLEGLEDKWQARWEDQGTYRFDRTRTRDQIYAIDTPPPTVSGSLHVGHVFSYTHTDTVARYKRMRGLEVFYPMGWDDNGLPTERRVQGYYGVNCDPSLPYDPGYAPPAEPAKPPVAISRPNFVELCEGLSAEDERVFEALWRHLGLSVDWSQAYTTVGERARRASQRGFLRLLSQGLAYQSEAPTLWDVDFRTAVAQAEMEDRDTKGAYHRVRFPRADGDGADVEIETTRPELIAACVALVAHPDDARYAPLFGSEVLTPLYGVRVPVLGHPLADPEKGSGIAMVCTFGDLTDVTWWRELDLPTRSIVGRDGRLRPITWGEGPFVTSQPERAQQRYDEVAGSRSVQARTKVVEQLDEAGALVGEPKQVSHPVKYYERGDRPLEIVTSRQWYFRNGGRDPGLRAELIERGRQLVWHPPYMRARYESWVEGLNGDWLVSRQRYFGVPVPLWYPVGDDGEVDHDHPLPPAEGQLPIDPSTDAPEGYAEAQRGRPGGFVGDQDILDTWATSSLSPQIAGGWEDDPDLFGRVFPMDLRPQGHDIIRTWLFSTVVRSHHEFAALPWAHAALSGWILDPDRKKMSKSKGNVVTPMALLEEHGSDAVRYWAASGRPGVDTAFDPGQMKVGRRLAIKILNASRFVLSRLPEGLVIGDVAAAGAPAAGSSANGGSGGPAVSEPLDLAMLVELASLVAEATTAFEAYDYARALERTESFFWSFCDNYVELVKTRAYGSRGDGPAASAQAALGTALSVLLRLFAPFLPFVTEEVWSWWQPGSIHRSGWPEGGPGLDGDPAVLDAATLVLGEIRKAKTEGRRSMRAPVELLRVTAGADWLASFAAGAPDVIEAGSVAQLVTQVATQEAGAPAVEIVLGEDQR